MVEIELNRVFIYPLDPPIPLNKTWGIFAASGNDEQISLISLVKIKPTASRHLMIVLKLNFKMGNLNAQSCQYKGFSLWLILIGIPQQLHGITS